MSDTTVEFQCLRFLAKDLGDGTFSISTHDISGGAGVADSSVEVQGYRILAYDNGDGTFSLTTTSTGAADDPTIEHQGLRFKIHPAGEDVTIDGVSVPTYALVVNEV